MKLGKVLAIIQDKTGLTPKGFSTNGFNGHIKNYFLDYKGHTLFFSITEDGRTYDEVDIEAYFTVPILSGEKSFQDLVKKDKLDILSPEEENEAKVRVYRRDLLQRGKWHKGINSALNQISKANKK